MKKWSIIVCLAFLLIYISPVWGEEAGMKITSTEFSHNGNIPSKYTCDGKNVNPPLVFEGVPSGVKSLALIMDDPDAPSGMFVHWVLWNIAPDTKGIAEDASPKGAGEGITGYGRPGYGGPCPPSGTHRYFFKLYALDSVLELQKNSGKTDLEKAMKGHILGEAQIIGLYKRK